MSLLQRLRAANAEFAMQLRHTCPPETARGDAAAFVDLRPADDDVGGLTGALFGVPDGGLLACVAPAPDGGRMLYLDAAAYRSAIALRSSGDGDDVLGQLSVADIANLAGQPLTDAALSRIRAGYLLRVIAELVGEATEVKRQTARFVIDRKSTTGVLIDLPDVRTQLSHVHAWLDVLEAAHAELAGRADAPSTCAEAEVLLVAALRKLQMLANQCVQLNGGWGYIERNPVAAFYRELNAARPLLRISAAGPCAGIDWTQPFVAADDDERAFRAAFAEHLRETVKPAFDAWEADGRIPRDGFEQLGKRGYLGQACPREWGGGGAGMIRHMHMTEQMMLEDLFGLTVSTMLIANTVVPILTRYGSEDLKDRYLPAIANGRLIPCLAVTESGSAGAMVTTLATTAEDHGDHWVVNGNKHYITNSPAADVAFVLTRTTRGADAQGLTLLCVSMDLPGVEIVEKYAKLGAHASETGHIRFTDVKVPKQNTVGYVGSGLLYVVDVIVEERVLIAAAAVSYALYCLNRTLAQLPAQNDAAALADLRCEAAALRVRCWQTARRAAARTSISTDAAMLKYLCGDFVRDCIDACEDALLAGRRAPGDIAWLQRARLDGRVMSLFTGASGVMKDYYSRRVTAGLRLHASA